MGWLDPRIWCHPKIAGVAKTARWSYVAALAYSDGFGTEGVLTRGQLRVIECESRERTALIQAGLWIDEGDGAIRIHNWTERNGGRDRQRVQARERQRRKREREAGESRVTDRDNHRDMTRDIERDTSVTEGVTNSVTSRARHVKSEEVKREENPRGLTALELPDLQALTSYAAAQDGHEEQLWKRLCIATGATTKPADITKLERTIRAHHSTEREIVCAIEAATGPGITNPLGAALAELVKRAGERTAA